MAPGEGAFLSRGRFTGRRLTAAFVLRVFWRAASAQEVLHERTLDVDTDALVCFLALAAAALLLVFFHGLLSFIDV